MLSLKLQMRLFDPARFLGRSVLLLGLAVGLHCYGVDARAAPIKPSVLTQQSMIVYVQRRLERKVDSQGAESGEYYAERRKEAVRKAVGIEDPSSVMKGQGPEEAILPRPERSKPAPGTLKLKPPLTPIEAAKADKALRGPLPEYFRRRLADPESERQGQ